MKLIPRGPHGPLKDFAFTRLFSCDGCGGGITATEKVKRLTDGTIKRYVYYHCTNHNGSCKDSYLREEELLSQLLKLVDCLDIDELGTIEIVKTELAKMQKLLSIVSRIDVDPKTVENIKKIDVHACAKLVLQEGSKEEKRQLLDQLKSKIIVKNRKLVIEKTKKTQNKYQEALAALSSRSRSFIRNGFTRLNYGGYACIF